MSAPQLRPQLVPVGQALHEDVAAVLARLPHGADAIAQLIADEQLRGIPGSALLHPLARWLTRALGDPHSAWLTGAGLTHVVSMHAVALVALPLHAARFAALFDEGEYPDLQLPRPSAPQCVSGPAPGTAVALGRVHPPATDDTAVLAPVRIQEDLEAGDR